MKIYNIVLYCDAQKTGLRQKFVLPLLCVLAFVLYSCASIGNPEGGPRDEDPPRFVSANPMLGATNVSRNRVEIYFDELVNVRDAFKSVVVSPVSRQFPHVSTSGHKIIVNFQDSLKPNTTYTIDFGNAIEDNNENNKLQGFAYWFSTGETIDSLQISGIVLDAQTLEPQQGMLVGVHNETEDSLFRKKPLLRAARTDDYGRFVMRNLAPGQYRLFALGDLNNDYIWDNPEEVIAFYPQLITPGSEFTSVSDTLRNMKTGEVDSIVQRSRTRFLPNNILLSSFKTDFKPNYLLKHERPDSTYINLIFNFRSDSLPQLSLTDFPQEKDWCVIKRSVTNDTLQLWLKPDFVRMDTLRISAGYNRTAFDKPIEFVKDTLNLIRPKLKPVKPKNKVNADTASTIEMKFLDVKIQSGSHNIYAPLSLDFSEPPIKFFPEGFRLLHKKDTIWTEMKERPILTADSLNPLHYTISHPWKYGTEYRLEMDSISVISMYGHHNIPIKTDFRIKSEEDYGNLYFNIAGLPDSIPSFIELLNGSDSPVFKAAVSNGTAKFENIDPNKYYARLIVDINNNGKWDSGDYLTQTQPEDVYYYPTKINLKKNWDIEQSWNLNERAVDKQKPEDIKKNKPATPKNAIKKKQDKSDADDEEEPFDVNRNPFSPNNHWNNNGLKNPSMLK